MTEKQIVESDEESNASSDLSESYVEVPHVVDASSCDDSQEDVQEEESTTEPERFEMEILSSAPSEDDDDDDGDEAEDQNEARKIGAGIAIGIVAAPIVGPALAVLAGVGGAYGTTQTGAAGDACRAAGDVALLARDKAFEINNKHDIVNKTKDGANELINTAKEADRQHHIVKKVQEVVRVAIVNIVSFIKFAAEKMNNNDDKEKSDIHTKSYEPVPARVHEDGVVS
jgi:hypothetical protein